ncbi:hypothetical protein H1S01_01335 [Heliobacterium chlorum]|uniref:Uncharacterized protein n=1 Tax=Heliobacterium chlorum TaxID=2698 RepID=A0ABR7SX66_HELCL|nr:hypothetical protein [Heliobacterium chlorum]MBC9783149.1 hypothetical protein [Heliobacterium chlorum]
MPDTPYIPGKQQPRRGDDGTTDFVHGGDVESGRNVDASEFTTTAAPPKLNS